MPISISPFSSYNLQDLVIYSCGKNFSTVWTCESINKVPIYKYLGVVFEEKVTWNVHIALVKKTHKYIFAFKNLSAVLNKREHKMALFAYIQSLLFVKIIVWEGAYKTTFKFYLVNQSVTHCLY